MLYLYSALEHLETCFELLDLPYTVQALFDVWITKFNKPEKQLMMVGGYVVFWPVWKLRNNMISFITTIFLTLVCLSICNIVQHQLFSGYLCANGNPTQIPHSHFKSNFLTGVKFFHVNFTLSHRLQDSVLRSKVACHYKPD